MSSPLDRQNALREIAAPSRPSVTGGITGQTKPAWELRRIAREALAGTDTPADSEAAEARCARLQQALRDAEVGFSDISVILEGENRGYRQRAYRRACDEWKAAREALAGTDTPADSLPKFIGRLPHVPADSRRIECDGGPYCKASPHTHGCLADKGDCDHPSEHADSHQADENRVRAEQHERDHRQTRYDVRAKPADSQEDKT